MSILVPYPFPASGVDPLIEISWQQYYPGLIAHEAVTGAVTHLLRASPRWRGTASYGAQQRGSEPAIALESLLMQLSGGVNHTRLPLYHKPTWKPTLAGTAANDATITVQAASPSPGTVAVPARDGMGNGVVFRMEAGPRVFMVTKATVASGVATLQYWPRLSFETGTELMPATSIEVQASPGDANGSLLVSQRDVSGPWTFAFIERIP